MLTSDTKHFLIIPAIDGVPARVFGELDDSQFQTYVTDCRVDLPRGWRFIHVPQNEIDSGSPRFEIVKRYPVVTLAVHHISGGTIANMLYNALSERTTIAHNPDWQSIYEGVK